jgi:hypothetical protein
MNQPNLREIDLSQTTKEGGAGLECGPVYLILYSGRFYSGTFNMQWYGLNFRGIYDAGAQYDPPGKNFSSWQRIWLITNANTITSEAEPEFAKMQREWAIGRMESNKQLIDESTPIEAYLYNPTKSAMPPLPDQDEEDY